MTRQTMTLGTDDLSAFTRMLARQLGPEAPSHLRLMNMLARAAGYANVQHLRAAQAATRRLARPVSDTPVDARLVERALAQFDGAGRLRRWPARRAVQDVALWAMWAALPARHTLTEREVNDLLRARHLFGDPATLRRCLIGAGLLTRRPDGSDYRRIERAPSPEARALLDHLARRAAR